MEESLGSCPAKFAEELARSGAATIDSWLGSHPSRWARAYGAYAIAATLAPLEAACIGTPGLSGDWHAWLFQQLRQRDGIDLTRVQVITFNYDSLIKWAFVEMIASSFGTSRDEAVRMIHQWDIQHVYGAFTSKFEADDLAPYKSHPLGSVPWFQFWIRLADAQRVPDNDAETEERKRIWNADRIVFLGFGFDPLNLRHLGIGPGFKQWSAKNRTVFATAYGMGAFDRSKVAGILGNGAVLGDHGEGCLGFLGDKVGLVTPAHALS